MNNHTYRGGLHVKKIDSSCSNGEDYEKCGC